MLRKLTIAALALGSVYAEEEKEAKVRFYSL